jgi:hypothetical protein
VSEKRQITPLFAELPIRGLLGNWAGIKRGPQLLRIFDPTRVTLSR